MLATRGNIAAAHRGLIDAGAHVGSLTAFRRRLARDMTPGQRAYARDGVEGRRARDVYLRCEPERRGQLYEADHKQLAIEDGSLAPPAAAYGPPPTTPTVSTPGSRRRPPTQADSHAQRSRKWIHVRDGVGGRGMFFARMPAYGR